MDLRWRISVGLIVAVWCLAGCKRTGPGRFSRWETLKDTPVAGAIVLKEAEQSPCTWRVEQEGDNVSPHRVTENGYQRPHELRIQFAGSTLIGEDRGEWGGGLSVIDAQGGKPLMILQRNVLQMFSSDAGVVVIVGDLNANQGSVWLFAKNSSHERAIEMKTDLRGYPRVAEQRGDDILLVYGEGVSVVESGFKERKIADLPLLELHPNSTARVARSDIYVGMKAFVVRLALGANGGYSQQWLTEQGCLPRD